MSDLTPSALPSASLRPDDPSAYIEDLLYRRVAGLHEDADIADVLISLAESTRGAEWIDDALRSWIVASWPPQPRDDVSTTRIASAWSSAFKAVGSTTALPSVAVALTNLLEESRPALDWLNAGPAADPLGDLLLAVARHQLDRSHANVWWELCSLQDATPWYRGEIGLVGLANLPPGPDDVVGGFPRLLPAGIAAFGAALVRQVRTGALPETDAKTIFVSTGRRYERKFPMPDRWAELAEDLQPTLEALPEGWLKQALPALVPGRRPDEANRVTRPLERPDPGWLREVREIATLLLRQDSIAESRAESLLAAQRRYASVTGDVDPLVRSLTNFAGKSLHAPTASRRWAAEATEWDPLRVVSWQTLVQALAALGAREEAAAVSLGNLERFPANDRSYKQLGLNLSRVGQPEVALLALRTAIHRFPEDAYYSSALAGVLAAQQDFAAAEETYRLAIDRFSDNLVLRAEFGAFLAAKDPKDPEALQLLEAVESRDPSITRARVALATVRKGERPSMPHVGAAVSTAWTPDTISRLRIHRLLRNAERLGIQGSKLSNNGPAVAAGDVTASARAAAEATLSEALHGEPRQALSLGRKAMGSFPGSVTLAFAAASSERSVAQMDGWHFQSSDAKRHLVQWERIGALRAVPGIVSDLATVRSLAGLVDGAALDAELVATSDRLVTRLSVDPARDTHESTLGPWFAAVLGPILSDRTPNRVRSALAGSASELDDLEEAAFFSLA